LPSLAERKKKYKHGKDVIRRENKNHLNNEVRYNITAAKFNFIYTKLIPKLLSSELDGTIFNCAGDLRGIFQRKKVPVAE
jgi:hypothetical protein